MKNYGMPYMGSKSKILEFIFENLPEADTLYDLFGGGGSVSDYAATNNKYKKVVYNEYEKLVYETFKKACNGEYKNETRWISREDFNKLKETDGYVKLCWSFGNNGKAYMYSREVEYWKKAFHFAAVFNDFSMFEEMDIHVSTNETETYKRKLDIGRQIKKNKDEFKRKYIAWFLHKIEGFEIDDVEKLFIDLSVKKKETEESLRKYLCDALKSSGLKQNDVNKKLGTHMAGHYFGRNQWAFPTKKEYEKMQQFMPDLKKNHYEITQLKTLQDTLKSLQNLQNLEILQSQNLESLQKLKSLESLQNLKSLEFFNRSYDEVDIKGNAVIYCDIPYKNTCGYASSFDYENFYDWCEKQTVPIFISEYWMPEDRFECIAQIKKRSLLDQNNTNYKIEKLFIPKKQKERIGD